jgi:cytoskeleton protein RodZ
MTSEETNKEVIETEELVETSPGELLANRREELGLGLQHVADQLHITMHYVRALESNAYDKLPGDIFVRGYIRSYASLLKLDVDALINAYKHYASNRECVEQSVKNTKLKRRSDKNLPWFIVSAIALITVAIALWYFNADDSESVPAAATLPAVSAPRGTPVQSTNTFVRQSVDLGTPASATEPMALSDGLNAVEAVDSEVQDLGIENSETNVELDPAAIQQSDEQSAELMPPVAASTVEIPTQILPVGNVINVDAGGDDVLKITFSGESIVQIDDSSEKQIYRDIRVAGDVLEVTGSAPFNILLGDAASTALTLNGSVIDFKTSIRVDNSARLTIGL